MKLAMVSHLNNPVAFWLETYDKETVEYRKCKSLVFGKSCKNM